ncbi:MAG: hypothetical protein JWM49_1588 [Microbacteriaceae bacterium]|jgi:hypothetical protein|nr:hypothetical protein [Microbacteriaceae bacterium]
MTDSTNRPGGNGQDRLEQDRVERDRIERDRVERVRVEQDRIEPDGTFTDEEYEEGTNTVEHGQEHSEGGDYTDTDFTEDEADRAKRHD